MPQHALRTRCSTGGGSGVNLGDFAPAYGSLAFAGVRWRHARCAHSVASRSRHTHAFAAAHTCCSGKRGTTASSSVACSSHASF